VSALLTNDAAILLLTPLVLAFVRRRYTDRQLTPFAFAVFAAAGVAPFVTSNPMNMVVASYIGLNFNNYAASMLPISLTGSVLSYLLLRRVFARDLAETPGVSAEPDTDTVRTRDDTATTAFTETQIAMVLLLVGVVALYPLVAQLDGGAIWLVAVLGAVLALWLAGHAHGDALGVWRGVAWDVVVFLPAVFVLSIGLRNVGLVDLLSSWYRDAGLATIGATAAIGSAALNNHPMALVNMLALEARPGTGTTDFLAALVGGDLGPRLLPTGSLAGLLWLESCRRFGLHVSAGRFIVVGAILTVPTLAVSLAMLMLF
jgi:arsenical pump membrane protein